MRRRLLVAAAAVTGVGVLVILIAGILQLAHGGHVVPSVTLAGDDVGGLSHDEARAHVAELARQLQTEPITLSYDGESWTLMPSDIGFEVDVTGTVAALKEVGRDRGTIANLFGHITTLWTTEHVDVARDWEPNDLDDWLAVVAGSIDQTPFPGGIDIDADSLEVGATDPQKGQEVDQAGLRSLVLDAFLTPGTEELEVPVDVVPIRIEPAQVAAVAELARAALAAPMTLTHELGDLEVTQQDLAGLLTLREVETDDGWEAELHVEPGAVEEVFANRAGIYEVEPVNASYDVDREPPVTFDDKSTTSWRKVPQTLSVVPATEGSTFDLERAAAQIAELARSGSRSGPLNLLTIEPEFSTADAEAGRPTHLLSTFTTYHKCCQSRVTNIQRLADMVDGALVHPGDQFSINQISGERRCSRGFVEAGMILRGEIVPSCGGGVSQFGTTTFNAAFFAGVQLDDWKAHSFYISRYPRGREATINYPSPDIDVLWTNTTDSPILVKTSYTRTSITVSFWGRSDVDEVEALHGQPTRWTNWRTEYRENKNLAPGTSRTIQSGQRGFTVVVVRKVHRGNDVEEREIVTRYLPERQIIERNSDPAPDPSPSEDPSEPNPSESPSPDPDPDPDPTPEPSETATNQ